MPAKLNQWFIQSVHYNIWRSSGIKECTMHSLTKGNLGRQNESKIRRYRLFALDFGAIDDLIQA